MKTVSTFWETSPAWKAAIAFSAGAYASAFLPDRWAIVAGQAILPATCVGLVLVLLRIPSRSTFFLAAGVAVCILLGAAKFLQDRDRLPQFGPLGHHRVRLVGEIIDDPGSAGLRRRFVCRAERVLIDSVYVPFSTDVAVTVMCRNPDSLSGKCSYGAKVVLEGLLERPSLERNPGEMSMRAYYEALGITHVLDVRGEQKVCVLDAEGGAWWMRKCVYPARRWMLDVFTRTTGREEGEFLKGLILGERGGMGVLTREAFVNAGVAHVLAVSGSNVAVVAAVLFLLLDVLRIPRFLRIVPMLAGLLFYMVVTGSQPPVVRATVMASVMLIGRALQRPVNGWNCLGVSAIIIMAIDARQLFDVGFQLSYGAVISLMALYPVMNGWIGAIPGTFPGRSLFIWLLRVCAVSLSATLGTLPLTASCFGRVSIIGILANIIVIPATELSVLLGAATLGSALVNEGIAHIYGSLNWFVLHWTLVLTRVAGFSPVAYIDTVRFVPFDAVPYYMVLGAAFFGSSRRLQHLTIALLASVALESVFSEAFSDVKTPGLLRVSIIDVGQGDAVLVELPGTGAFLVDAGPRTATFDAGTRTVLPFLKRRGIRALEFLAVTHVHADHIGGLASVVSVMKVQRILTVSPQSLGASLGSLWREDFPPMDSCVVGQPIALSPAARIYVLYPLHGIPTGRLGGNESLVVKVVYGSVSLLLTGDADAVEESLLIGRFGTFIHADLLKAGHHGSKTSSSDEFLDVVQPRAVSISVGRHNKFNHPSPTVIRRYLSRAIDIGRTDEEGALVYESDGYTIWKTAWR